MYYEARPRLHDNEVKMKIIVETEITLNKDQEREIEKATNRDIGLYLKAIEGKYKKVTENTKCKKCTVTAKVRGLNGTKRNS